MSAFLPLDAATGLAPPRRAADGFELTKKASALTPVKQTFRQIWFFLLLGSICLEGLGRRYLPGVPSAVFYFFKDVVLVAGLIRYRINREVSGVFKSLFAGFVPVLKLAVLWTFVEIINPDQASITLGLLGFRAYWLWWFAPLIVASVLLDPVVRRKVVVIQSAIAMVVAVLAILQFGSPVDDAINTYSTVDGEASLAIPVTSTGRARVSSTFSFITGFGDFAVLVPVLLLSIGLGERERTSRLAALTATLFSAAALPMAGSRGPFALSLVLCLVVVWRAGLIFTRVGRRVILVAVVAGLASVFAFPDALQGVRDRFEEGDTKARMAEFFDIVPPVALAKYKDGYTILGIGTGMTQNYRGQFGVVEDIGGAAEGEVARHLWELGPIGYLLVWSTRIGLVVVLLRAARILKRGGRRAASAGALAYAFLALYGGLVFDHIFCALFFVGFGFILQEVVQVRLASRARAREHGAFEAAARAPVPS